MIPHLGNRDRFPAVPAAPSPWAGVAPPPGIGFGFGDVPVGAVIPYAGSVEALGTMPVTVPEPAGWLPCIGQYLAPHLYPQLFGVIGYLYGRRGDDFRVPDYRGIFLRGVDAGAGADPDIPMRTAAPGATGVTGAQDAVGSTQTSAFQTHAHDYDYAQDSKPSASGGGAAGTQTSTTMPTGAPVRLTDSSPDPNTSVKETRPINVYVNFLIKHSTASPFGI